MTASAEPRHKPEPAVTYTVGDHKLELTCTPRWQWIVSIDSRELPTQYASQADAWAAGVREAYGLH
jgi:hypothetical protein